jgi:hypothetical protein
MTQEDKELLLKDLCARLPYGVKVDAYSYSTPQTLYSIDVFRREYTLENGDFGNLFVGFDKLIFSNIKPYLRSMSSMTDEERKEFSNLLNIRYCDEDWDGHISTSYCIVIEDVYTDDEGGIKCPTAFSMEAIDWLNAHHFDYRGLIEEGLALEAPKGMY